jgi:hypothetical protein
MKNCPADAKKCHAFVTLLSRFFRVFRVFSCFFVFFVFFRVFSSFRVFSVKKWTKKWTKNHIKKCPRLCPRKSVRARTQISVCGRKKVSADTKSVRGKVFGVRKCVRGQKSVSGHKNPGEPTHFHWTQEKVGGTHFVDSHRL